MYNEVQSLNLESEFLVEFLSVNLHICCTLFTFTNLRKLSLSPNYNIILSSFLGKLKVFILIWMVASHIFVDTYFKSLQI